MVSFEIRQHPSPSCRIRQRDASGRYIEAERRGEGVRHEATALGSQVKSGVLLAG